ncbi:MAG: nucleoside triphosphate pyrophosphohydrolase [Gammaproteobacteria bacterium]|nr:nucleoside triphosphate pyrophosphohydrolase [Gammaproteobacteria bacterium]
MKDTGESVSRLLRVVARLRDPENGCPWDAAQNFNSIVPHTLEEACEVADAIERGDLEQLADELGDLLFQVALYAQLGAEENRFDFVQVVDNLSDKLIRRHPHVFAGTRHQSGTALSTAWEEQKKHERQERARRNRRQAGILDDIPLTLPALARAVKLQKRALQYGRAGGDVDSALERVRANADALRGAQHADAGKNQEAEMLLGQMLFNCADAARHLGLDAEQALRGANRRFAESVAAQTEHRRRPGAKN